MNRFLINVPLVCMLLCSTAAEGTVLRPIPAETQTAHQTHDAATVNGFLENTLNPESPGAEPKTTIQNSPEYRIKVPLAIKTNLLFAAVGGFNLGIEVPLGRNFSVMGDFSYAYWRVNSRIAMQVLQGGIEAKYWFNPKKQPLTGWSLGVYGIFSGPYDIQWMGGWQGDRYYSTGLVAGYSLPVSKSLNLEFSAAAGAFYTPEARKYSRPADGYLMWEETRYNVWRVLPAKLKVNLIWLIQTKKRTVAQ